MIPFRPSIRMCTVLASLAAGIGVTRTQAADAAAAAAPMSAPATSPSRRPTIFIAGDSTAARLPAPRCGWGVPFPEFFNPAKVDIVNLARGGRSSRTFITEGLWAKLLARVKPGDIVLIQFGHNDAGAINQPPPGSHEPLRARGSLPGLGDQTEAIDNAVTHKHEIVHTFGWYMRRMIEEARNRGATPIVLGITVRDIWHDGKVENGMGHYTPWSQEVAKQEDVAFVNLTAIAARHYEQMGPEAVKKLFPLDHTHTNAAGAELNARWVVAGLKALPRSLVTPWLSPKGEAVPPAPKVDVHSDFIAWLNLPTPANPQLPTLFLVGDSTVRNGRADGSNGQWGWGDELAPYFDTTRINVVNRAVGGTTYRTFLTSGYWGRVLAMMKPGDFVMMQFGTNNGGPINDDFRARGTLRGIGDQSEAIDNLLTHQHEVVHTFGWYVRKFIADARAKGATPIVCSMVPQKVWKDGHIVRKKTTFAGWAGEVAAAEHAPFVDLNEIIARRYDQLGPAKVEPLFGDPHTHASLVGAKFNAACVISGLKGLADDPLAPYLSAQAAEVSAYRP